MLSLFKDRYNQDIDVIARKLYIKSVETVTKSDKWYIAYFLW